MSIKPRKLNAERSKQLTRLLTISKTATLTAVMTPSELAKIIALVSVDIGKSDDLASSFPMIWPSICPPDDYYSISSDWFKTTEPPVQSDDLIALLEKAESLDEDFMTYLRCLMELHKRRRKYGMILERQPLPTMVQVSPRALMEYGPDFPTEALASWLTWRKFFYDLDNRSAQETGYLFEPILASAIGGEPMSAKEKVVHRSNDPSKGRQVDCWRVGADGQPLAYELKLRVTIAASGQGRFAEELSFAEDCRASGVKPVLVVLDPTENNKLTDLQAAYRRVGGECYVGDDAWRHLEDEAGSTMAAFIEKYVRQPVAEISAFERIVDGDPKRRNLVLLNLATKLEGNQLSISLGDFVRRIERHEDPSLSSEGDGEDD
ncbi:restriction endonuclease [Pseudomonas proteolytica]|uniref:restriction endonuclease n=1 Tax=Pseudomonas proteolytica TaxID=219574 RepID=UPI001474845D|nr:restriction endonuclease [Pseudomonas proteolytica]NMZ00583.1 restriction endonuclease [Pseudomonas proteolytica]